jgi:hypothetical protein
VGVLGLAVAAGPWIGVLSVKRGAFTVSTAGTLNHATVAPPDVPHSLRVNESLRTPPEGHICAWEHPEDYPGQIAWSPFDSPAHLAYQMKVVAQNLWKLVDLVRGYDLLCLVIALVGGAPVVALAWRGHPGGWFHPLWLAGTFLLYCSGYLTMFIDARYVLPVLVPLGWIYCVSLAHLLQSHWRAAGRDGSPPPRRAGLVLAGVLLLSFGVPAAARFARDVAYPYAKPYRAAAQRLAAAGCRGPLASTQYDLGLYAAFHMNQPFLGSVLSKEPEACRRELDEHPARTFLVDSRSPLWNSFQEDENYKLLMTLPDMEPTSEAMNDFGNPWPGAVKVFVRVPRPGGPAGPAP